MVSRLTICMRRCTKFCEQKSILFEEFGLQKEQWYCMCYTKNDSDYKQADEINPVW